MGRIEKIKDGVVYIIHIIIIAVVFLGCSEVDKEQSEFVRVEEVKPDVKEVKSGESIYLSKCAPCHGLHGEKNALSKSQVIAGWKSEKVESALAGYKDGSYGGDFKEMMRGQVGQLDSNETHLVAKYVSEL